MMSFQYMALEGKGEGEGGKHKLADNFFILVTPVSSSTLEVQGKGKCPRKKNMFRKMTHHAEQNWIIYTQRRAKGEEPDSFFSNTQYKYNTNTHQLGKKPS